MNSEMKLSYEDLALLLGKEKSTIRGQVNAIKQKKEGLIEEISEKNGKKRVYVPEEIKEKLAKYAKVRVGKKRKVRTSNVLEENI
jgi:chromosome segregation and condensation protein ScpB